MYDHITTYSGIHIVPTDPDVDRIRIEDIAHALSLLCRGNGHVKTFFSVGQHCLNCALEARKRGYSDRLAMACLLHDASEAYMSDVPRPFKQHLKGYIAAEKRLFDLIYTKYLGSPLTEEEERRLKQIDDDLLYYDLRELLNEPQEEPAPVLGIALSYEWRTFEEVEREYLQLFHQIRQALIEKNNRQRAGTGKSEV